ncbi:MAG: hypothetical protein AAB632_01150 [Patescibacteria group bacterium]
MKQVQFTITAEEVRSLSEKELSDRQVQDILDTIENDQVLWEKIQESIRVATEISSKEKAK